MCELLHVGSHILDDFNCVKSSNGLTLLFFPKGNQPIVVLGYFPLQNQVVNAFALLQMEVGGTQVIKTGLFLVFFLA